MRKGKIYIDISKDRQMNKQYNDVEEDNIQWEEISKVMSRGKEAGEPTAKVKLSRPSPAPSKTYPNLYEELLDKCDPKNFMEPYDQAKVEKAIRVYGDLQKADKKDTNRLREIRDRAMQDLGITVSTDRLYKELIGYCDSRNFRKDGDFPTEVLLVANQFYAQVLANKHDIHALEKLASQMYADATLSRFYEEKKEKEEKEKEKKKRERLEQEKDETKALLIGLALCAIIISVLVLFSVIVELIEVSRV